jgi:hypothetical protein
MAKAKNTEEAAEKKPAAKKSSAAKKGAAADGEAATPKKRTDSQKGAEQKSEAAAPAAGESTAPEAAVDQTETQAETPLPAPELRTYEGVALPALSGKAGVLGGPKDRGGKPEDKLALPIGKHFTYERVRSLNPKSFYCAMRWDYKILNKSPEEAKRWWANKKLVVTNPTNGNRVVVRAVDFGPHENTGLAISLSPGALEALEIEIGDEVEIDFADQKEPVGNKQ